MADEAMHYGVQCPACGSSTSPGVLITFGFDQDGYLSLQLVCRFCLIRFEVGHSVAEILADIETAKKAVEKEAERLIEGLDGTDFWKELED